MAPKYQLAVEEARRGADSQAATLASLRSLSAWVVATGGLSATFLSGVTSRDTGITLWALPAIACFVVIVVIAVSIAWPVRFWTSQEPSVLVQWVENEGADHEKQQRDLALYLEQQYDDNAVTIKGMQKRYAVALAALVAELIFLLIGLWGR